MDKPQPDTNPYSSGQTSAFFFFKLLTVHWGRPTQYTCVCFNDICLYMLSQTASAVEPVGGGFFIHRP